MKLRLLNLIGCGLLGLALAAAAQGAVHVQTITYQGHRATKISNGTVQLIVLTDVGPRVIFYGFVNGPNEFHEFAEQLSTPAKKWVSYGGARLWVAPETESVTYFPDNVPVKVERRGAVVRFIAPLELKPLPTHLQKIIAIRLAPTGSEVTLTYSIHNRGRKPLEMAPWAISVMARDGHSILPLPPRAPWGPKNFLPNGLLTLWPYTDFSDPRWVLGEKYIELRQQRNPHAHYTSQKIGVHDPAGWGAYYRQGNLFVKRARFHAGAKYPDFGCNFETYTEPAFLELESLGPMRRLAPGATAVHVERWWLFSGVKSGHGDAWVEKAVMPRVNQTSLR